MSCFVHQGISVLGLVPSDKRKLLVAPPPCGGGQGKSRVARQVYEELSFLHSSRCTTITSYQTNWWAVYSSSSSIWTTTWPYTIYLQILNDTHDITQNACVIATSVTVSGGFHVVPVCHLHKYRRNTAHGTVTGCTVWYRYWH